MGSVLGGGKERSCALWQGGTAACELWQGLHPGFVDAAFTGDRLVLNKLNQIFTPVTRWDSPLWSLMKAGGHKEKVPMLCGLPWVLGGYSLGAAVPGCMDQEKERSGNLEAEGGGVEGFLSAHGVCRDTPSKLGGRLFVGLALWGAGSLERLASFKQAGDAFRGAAV